MGVFVALVGRNRRYVPMRLLEYRNECVEPGFNLAMDELLMGHEACKREAVFGFWQNRPCVIVGVHQCAEREVNLEYCHAEDVPVVRRCTGGGAVYHDFGNLNFSLFVPAAGRGLETDYRICHELFAPIFAEMGVEIELSQTNDLLLKGKKFSGMASRKTQDVHLYHGTLLFDVDTRRMSLALGNPEGKFVQARGVKSRHAEVINLRGWLPGVETMEDFRVALECGLRKRHEVGELTLSPEFLEAVRVRACEGYVGI